jgi:hypothetical protein
MFGAYSIDKESIVDIITCNIFEDGSRRVSCDCPLEIKVCRLKSGHLLAGNDLVRIYVTAESRDDLISQFSKRLVSDYFSSISNEKKIIGFSDQMRTMYRRDFREILE